MPDTLHIKGRTIGSGHPCFIIAEAGVNHNGDMAMARRLIEVAAEAGADAVKFQTFKAEKLVSAHAAKAEYQKAATSADESQQAMLKKLELPPEEHRALADHCARLGIMFLSSPFEEQSADFLQAMGVAALKIPSGEITNHPFLTHVAAMGLPLILSSGMSSLAEVDEALATLRNAGNPPVALLHCLSNYPADPAECNLRAMDTLRTAFQIPIGYSDHTLGCEIPFAAVARGACIIEKHITLDKTLPGPDQRASLEPAELRQLVRGIRMIESSLGDGRKLAKASERNTAEVARKSITAAVSIPAGTVLTPAMLVIRRPGNGLPSRLLPLVAGRTARADIPAGTTLGLSHLQ